MKHLTHVLALGAILGASPILAQEASTPVRPRAHSQSFGQVQLLSDLLNWNIVLQNNNSAGQITDFVIGPQGNVLWAVGTLGGQNFVIPFSAINFNTALQTAQLNITPDQFAMLPLFTGRRFPNSNSQVFQRDMKDVFGDRAVPSMSLRGRGNLGANETERSDTQTGDDNALPSDEEHALQRDRTGRDSIQSNRKDAEQSGRKNPTPSRPPGTERMPRKPSGVSSGSIRPTPLPPRIPSPVTPPDKTLPGTPDKKLPGNDTPNVTPPSTRPPVTAPPPLVQPPPRRPAGEVI